LFSSLYFRSRISANRRAVLNTAFEAFSGNFGSCIRLFLKLCQTHAQKTARRYELCHNTGMSDQFRQGVTELITLAAQSEFARMVPDGLTAAAVHTPRLHRIQRHRMGDLQAGIQRCAEAVNRNQMHGIRAAALTAAYTVPLPLFVETALTETSGNTDLLPS
jgi:hypothetical protein